MSALTGSVASLFVKFKQLPEETKVKVGNAAKALITQQKELVKSHSVSMFKSVQGIQASELTKWLMEKEFASNNEEAVTLGEALVNGLFLAPISMHNFSKFEQDNKVYLLTDQHEQSVFSMIRGATRAEELSIPTRFSWKKVYGIANKDKQKFAIYETDSSLEPMDFISFDSDKKDKFVTYSANQKDAVVVESTDGKLNLTLKAKTHEAMEDWLQEIINAGAVFREELPSNTDVNSFYDLKDRDMDGNIVSMDQYKGKVVLVVNVSSLCGLTPANYTQLAEMDQKYKDKGLAILGFPCNQFARQEPGTNEEICALARGKYKVEFPLFEKADVNGAHARPVFAYLKGKLPGSFGNFVKWNFTKFLVDRNGNPYKRYAPKDEPNSFEEDIKKLLEQSASE